MEWHKIWNSSYNNIYVCSQALVKSARICWRLRWNIKWSVDFAIRQTNFYSARTQFHLAHILWWKISKTNGKNEKNIVLYHPVHTNKIRSRRYTNISRSFASFFWIFFFMNTILSFYRMGYDTKFVLRTKENWNKMVSRCMYLTHTHSVLLSLNGCRTKDKDKFVYRFTENEHKLLYCETNGQKWWRNGIVCLGITQGKGIHQPKINGDWSISRARNIETDCTCLKGMEKRQKVESKVHI